MKLVENIFESFKIITQGKVFWVRAKEVSGWIPVFVEGDQEESDTDDEVRDKELHDECADMHNHETMEGESDVEEKQDNIIGGFSSDNLKYPLGFTPTVATEVQSNASKRSEIEGDEFLQNIHDEKVASKVKKTCPLSNSKDDR
ncbi:hypothetical protein Tco_0216137 [Tanacetum coccineum]